MTHDIENISTAFKTVLDEAAKKNEKLITQTLQKAPQDFRRAAIAFYPTVLKRRSGNLVRSIQGFLRKQGSDTFDIGLIAGGEVASYAGAQHDGANIPRRFIAPRVAKALRWYGGRMTKSGKVSKAKGNIHFSKGHWVKGFYLKPKKYLEKPLFAETGNIIRELIKKIGF